MARVAQGLRNADIIRLNRRAAWISGIKAVSVFRGDALRDYIKRIVPAWEWSELRFPLLANAVELETGRGHRRSSRGRGGDRKLGTPRCDDGCGS